MLCNKSVASRGPPSRDGVLRVLLFTQERGEEVDDPWGHGVAILTIQLQRRGAGTSVVIYVIYVWKKRRRNKKKRGRREDVVSGLDSFERIFVARPRTTRGSSA